MLLAEFRFGVGLSLSVGLSNGSRNKIWFVYPMDDALDIGMVLTISVCLFRLLFCPFCLLVEGIFCWKKVKYLIFGMSHLDGKA